ncbi:MAG: U32 family peptidase [Coriobacteriales bacterium]|jgi:putative protease|nr:U32 family peptidase [Coriobacteriales bacterium]
MITEIKQGGFDQTTMPTTPLTPASTSSFAKTPASARDGSLPDETSLTSGILNLTAVSDTSVHSPLELLCPVGGPEALLAALAGGADAVYLGVADFNARRNAPNFTLKSLRAAADLVHLAGARLYLTLNTAILPDEFDAALELARQAWYAGADALIVADLGLMERLHHEQPQIELHASTQAGAQSAQAVAFLSHLGATRVTLARELSLKEIASISSQKVDTEIFVHGALCVSYSGHCLMSSLVGTRSANRGLCSQPCRLPYRLIDGADDRVLKTAGNHLLSTADLAGIELVPELINTGTAALKIEGRMRKPHYVYTTARAYRQALDERYGEKNESDVGENSTAGETAACNFPLRSAHKSNEGFAGVDGRASAAADLYTQRGFTSAYLRGKSDNTLMDYRRAQSQTVTATAPTDTTFDEGRLFVGNRGIVPLSICARAVIGKPLFLQAETLDGRAKVEICGDMVERAHSRTISAEELQEHLGRVGTTPFTVVDWHIQADEGIGLSFGTIHRLRSELLQELSAALLHEWHDRRLKPTHKMTALPAAARGKVVLAALVADTSRAQAAVASGVHKLYYHNSISYGIHSAKASRGASIPIWDYLPSIVHDRDLASLTQRLNSERPVVVNNPGELPLARTHTAGFATGPALAAYNRPTLELYARLGAQLTWLGPELSLKELAVLAPTSPVPLALTISGAQELMTTAHCVLMAAGPCNQQCDTCKLRTHAYFLQDRKDYRFPLTTDALGRSHLYNARSLDLVGEIPTLMALGISEFVVDCTLLDIRQTKAEVERAARGLTLALRGAGSLPKRKGRTTGHLFRGIY